MDRQFKLSRDNGIKLNCLLSEVDEYGASVVLKHDNRHIVLTRLADGVYVTDGSNVEVYTIGIYKESVEIAYPNSLLLEVINNDYIPYTRAHTHIYTRAEMDPETHKTSDSTTVITYMFRKPEGDKQGVEILADIDRVDGIKSDIMPALTIHKQLTNMIEKWNDIMEPLTEDNSDYMYYLKYGKEPTKEM